MKITAAALLLISLAALLALPCVCVADDVASSHRCCAPRTSMQTADPCCPPQVEPPIASAPFAITALPSEMPAFFVEPGTSLPHSTPLPRPIACARTPILRV